MRSVAAGSFERLTSPQALWSAFRKCQQGKSRQPRLAAFDIEADRHVLALAHSLRQGRFRPDPWSLRIVHEPKTRLIATPSIRDRVLHRALIDEIGPTYERSFVEQSFAWGCGRGPHRAVLRLLAALRTHRFRATLDIRRYFPSVHQPTLTALVAARLRPSDAATLDLVTQLLRASGTVYQHPFAREVLGLDADPLPPECGLGLGSYLSQWCVAMYLDGLDHYVVRECRPGAYLRYMDDLVLLDNDAARLEELVTEIREWVATHRGLQCKASTGRVVPTSEPCVFLGYRVSRAGLSPSQKLRRRFAQRVQRAARKGPDSLQRTLVSYRGLLCF